MITVPVWLVVTWCILSAASAAVLARKYPRSPDPAIAELEGARDFWKRNKESEEARIAALRTRIRLALEDKEPHITFTGVDTGEFDGCVRALASAVRRTINDA